MHIMRYANRQAVATAKICEQTDRLIDRDGMAGNNGFLVMPADKMFT